MAILHSILGKLTGKVADSSFYEDRAGQNILRSLPGERRPGTEAQQRWEAEFAALLDAAWLLGEAVYVGFPAGRKYPALEKGFLRANAKRAAEVEPIDPERPFVRKKGTPRYFKARVDYTRVLVADGTLVTPEVEVTEVRAGDEAGEHVGVRSTGQAKEGREEGKATMAEGWEEGQAKEAGMVGMEEARAAEGQEEGQAAERGDEGWMAMAERKGEEWRTEGEGGTAEMREEGLTAMAEGRKEGGEAGMEGRKGKAGREKRERVVRERVVRFGHRGTVRERWECFRGDRVYGAVAMPEEDYCRVHLLGVRGETWEREVRTEAMPEGTPLYVYVFAVTEDGRGVSPSACRAFLAEDAAADEEEG